jgi:amino acid transporter
MQQAETSSLKRAVGPVGLLFASLGGIIGSGWLFGALYAAQAAGPAALVSWIIGGIAVLLIALVYAELGAMFPVAGGIARYPHYSHGSLASFVTGWIAWIAYVTVAPIEVEATLQYATNYIPQLTHSVSGTVVLTPIGYVVAAVLLLIFSAINLIGVRSLSLTNSTITWWKLVIPTLTFLVLLLVGFHSSNLSAAGGFMPLGWSGVLSAVSTSGIIFSYLGFRQAVELAGETINPQRNVPLAVVGSVLIGIVVYFFLQLAFLGALRPQDLAHGWSKISFTGSFGPFAGLASALGLSWLAFLLYIDAIVSPAGTGLIYAGSTARLTYALAKNGYISRFFAALNQAKVPVWGIWSTFIVGLLVFLPFPGWQTLVGFISSATVLSYGAGPVSFLALRRQLPDQERPYQLGWGGLWASIAFIIANFIVLWTGWETDEKLFLAILVGLVIFAISYLAMPEPKPNLNFRSSIWLWPYLVGLALISYLGPKSFGGTGLFHLGASFPIVIIFSLVILWLATEFRLDPEEVKTYVQELS